jgi:hypothetical protein
MTFMNDFPAILETYRAIRIAERGALGIVRTAHLPLMKTKMKLWVTHCMSFAASGFFSS